MLRYSVYNAILFIMMLFFGSCAGTKNNSVPVTGFDVNKYVGKWHEVARLPNSFEKNLTDVTAEYSQNGKQIKVVNSGFHKIKKTRSRSVGVAKFKGDTTVGELKVSFFRPFYGTYRVVYLTEDYSVSVVVSDNYKYLWILSRTPKIEQDLLDKLLVFIKDQGFDTEKIIFQD